MTEISPAVEEVAVVPSAAAPSVDLPVAAEVADVDPVEACCVEVPWDGRRKDAESYPACECPSLPRSSHDQAASE